MNKKQNNNFKIEDAIKNMDKNKKIYDIYNSLWLENKFFKDKDIKVQKVFWQKDKKTKEDRYSNNSYAFQIDNEGNIIDNKKISNPDYFDSICKKLTEIFGIKDKARFKEKLEEACGGSGSEQRNITKLHASSLCALLFFYNVSKENPLTLTIDSREIEFKDVLFEFQNTVIEGKEKKPSNIDVVLLGKDKDNNDNKVILFLESKFSEYLSYGNAIISKSYSDLDKCPIGYNIYTKNNLKFLNIVKKEKNNKEDILQKEEKKDEGYYIEGIKQMVSHYIGIKNLLSNDKTEKAKFFTKTKANRKKLRKLCYFLSDNNKTYNYNEKLKNLLNCKEKTAIYLGEILFDFHNIKNNELTKFNKSFESYCGNEKGIDGIYQKLVGILKKLEEGQTKKISLLTKPLKYSLFKNEKNISSTIKKYYRLN